MLALVSTTLTNGRYLREHDAAAAAVPLDSPSVPLLTHPMIRIADARFEGRRQPYAALIACRLTETARARAARTAAVSVSTS